jgi:menaquinol-cytochrome c reductase cytochrome b/c subunit
VTEIPESLLRRSAEAKAKALGLPVEQVLAEMKGEAPPTPPTAPRPEAEPAESVAEDVASPEEEPAPVDEVPPAGQPAAEAPEIEVSAEADVAPAPPTEAPAEAVVEDPASPAEAPPPAAETPAEAPAADEEPAVEPAAAAVATAVQERPEPETNGAGNGKVASVVTPRPVVPPKGTPEGVRTQRLLTVVKARAIQTVKAEPTDKVNTWPHLMLMEFGALLAITGLLVIMSVVIHSPLLDPANFNATPNPSKAPWYFLGLQELLSYFDPQIAGVMVPTITGMIGFMMIPFVDKNPSNRPSDRKFAIALYSVFLAGSATLTMFCVLFRGRGFNFSYPWKDGVFFDDLKDWVQFE